MPSIRVGKVAAGLSVATGTVTVAMAAPGLGRLASVQTMPPMTWLVLATLLVVAGVIVSLGLILDYRQARLQIETVAELRRARQEMYRVLLEKSTSGQATDMNYRELIAMDALHLAVEGDMPSVAPRHEADAPHRISERTPRGDVAD